MIFKATEKLSMWTDLQNEAAVAQMKANVNTCKRGYKLVPLYDSNIVQVQTTALMPLTTKTKKRMLIA